MVIGVHFGPNKIYGIELVLFSIDPIDMALHPWEIGGIKILAQLFGLCLVVAGIEVTNGRAGLVLLNCHLTVFWS